MFQNLIPDLVREIAARLPCGLDRGSMAAVCPAWRNALALQEEAFRHPSCPLLFFPNAATPMVSCVICDGKLKPILIPQIARHGRFFGSYEDTWVFLAMEQISLHSAVHLRSGTHVFLPDQMAYEAGGHSFPVVIHAVSMSGPPMQQFTGGAIVEREVQREIYDRDVMFWDSNSIWGWGIQHQAVQPLTIEDMVFFNGSFCILTTNEQLVLVQPHIGLGDWYLNATVNSLQIRTEHRYHLENVHARYLVPCRGELLMAVRCRQQAGPNWYTSSFRVFRMVPVGDAGGIFAWSELDEFDGRMLFIARGSSRSYDVTDFDGWGCVSFQGRYGYVGKRLVFFGS